MPAPIMACGRLNRNGSALLLEEKPSRCQHEQRRSGSDDSHHLGSIRLRDRGQIRCL